MTTLLVYLSKSEPLETYISDKDNFSRRNFPEGSNRYLYTSPDESIVYETIMRSDNTEFVYTIDLQPSKEQNKLLCKPSP
jgi:hypothetical protein